MFCETTPMATDTSFVCRNPTSGMANGKFETLRDRNMITFLCEPETPSIFKLQNRASEYSKCEPKTF